MFDRLFAHLSICTVCCLQVIVWYFPLRVFVPTFPLFERHHHGLHVYLASGLGVFFGGHARRDVFLYPYCLLLCINMVIIDCMQLYLASALGVFYGGHARRDVFLYLHCLLLCINIVIMDCTQLYLASLLGVVYGGRPCRDVHPRYQEDRQTLFSYCLLVNHCKTLLGSTVVYQSNTKRQQHHHT